VKSHLIIVLIFTSLLAASASAQLNSGAQAEDGSSPQRGLGTTANRHIQSLSGADQDSGTYPAQLEGVLETMSAELAEIAQAAREGKISRDQAEYLSLERYYVALTRFQLLRTLYQSPAESNPARAYSQTNTAPQPSSGGFIIPSLTCSPDIPEQIINYLELTPVEIQALQAQVVEECKQVQPLMDRLEKSRLKLLSMKMNGKVDDREVQASAAEQSQIVKQLIVMNSQLETKLYSMLTSEQQRKVDGLLRQTLTSGGELTLPQ